MGNNDSTSSSVPVNNRLRRLVQTDTIYHVDVDVQTCATVLAREEFGCQVDSVSPIFQELSGQIKLALYYFRERYESFSDDGSVTLESKTDSIQSNTASLEHPLYTTKSAPIPTDVCTKISLIDSVFVNPASKSSLRVVLDKIAIDSGVSTGSRHFMYVVCDGSPMTLILQLIIEEPEKYSWVVPYDLGHEEMNMVKSFTEMFSDFILKRFFETQGYKTPKALAFAKRCSDHHIAFDNLFKCRESVWMELVYSFRNTKTSCVAENFNGFVQWLKDNNDNTLLFICNLMLPCLESIFMFRKGVRENNCVLIERARKIFRQIWYGRHHTKYMLIDSFGLCDRFLMPPEILNCLNKHESFSRSGRIDAHQGLDFI
ncbi:unnamed protein product [Mytilus edulis]|uniref:Uncharacterized protein n=1 Tax=Mytilus edulis TaxID=6550 RepID=A0A8S3TI56_MYTED|nr:unnamed protein product [Mytilus edulis]